MISVWHAPVCESVWLQSPIRYCFTYRRLQCYGHGGQKNIMENDFSTSNNEGRWWRDFTNGFHMTTAIMLWTSPHCHCVQLYILISKSTPHWNRVNVLISKAFGKICKLWINTYFTNCKRRTLSTKSDIHWTLFKHQIELSRRGKCGRSVRKSS